jgi:hypothetical protein
LIKKQQKQINIIFNNLFVQDKYNYLCDNIYSSKDFYMKKIFAMAAVAVTCSASVFAQSGVTDTGLNYNEVGAAYQSIKFDNTDGSVTLTGYGFNGSYMLDKNFYVLGSTGTATKTISGVKVTFSPTQAGLGYRLGVAKNVDGFASLNYVSVTNKSDEPTNTKTGYSLTAGVRALVAPGVDVSAAAMTQKIGDNSAKNGYMLGLGYDLTSSVVARISYTALKDVTLTSVGVAYKY